MLKKISVCVVLACLSLASAEYKSTSAPKSAMMKKHYLHKEMSAKGSSMSEKSSSYKGSVKMPKGSSTKVSEQSFRYERHYSELSAQLTCPNSL